METDILLEVGTNEIDIMEFTVADHVYGINVAKVREIMLYAPIRKMQRSHPVVEGVFKPRERLITVLNLAKYLDLAESDNYEKDIYIVADFNNMRIAFHVASVVGIDRITWKDISKPDRTIYGGGEGVATGIVEYDGRLITILDFEKIVSDICPESGIQVSDVDSLGPRERNNYPILVAEDSMLLAKLIGESLHKAGYMNVKQVNNGKEAWDYLEATKEKDSEFEEPRCLITDLEMPQMDGHRLIRLVREDKEYKKLPIIIFSSLINEEMKRKGASIGANEQISKPEIAKLVGTIDELVGLK